MSTARGSGFILNGCSTHGNLNSEKLKNRLREFQWGFSPMELTDANPRFNRFSLPTKVVSYLAAGLAIITVGHTESTVGPFWPVATASGVAIDDTNIGKIDSLLLASMNMCDPWPSFGLEILRAARTEFDAEIMRARLYQKADKVT